MLRQIAEELEHFSAALQALRDRGWVVQEIAEDAFVLGQVGSIKLPPQKDIALTIMGLIHGNEVAGLAAITDWLRLLSLQTPQLAIPVAVVLGNVKATRLNQRFCDRDLNRSFARQENNTWEDRRARVLEKVLQRSAFLLDLHQTILPSVSPFFIFPYAPESFRWAQEINGRLPLVTHWGAPFSADGCCTDEYTNNCGGVGITLELGQNGFAPALVAAGSQAIEKAVATVTTRLMGASVLPIKTVPEVYTWAESIPYPPAGEGLRPGYINFADVHKGERLGGSDQDPVVCRHEGKILFPKYPPPGAARPAELCRIIRRVKPEELGKDKT